MARDKPGTVPGFLRKIAQVRPSPFPPPGLESPSQIRLQGCVVRECLAELLRNPKTTWMSGDIEVQFAGCFHASPSLTLTSWHMTAVFVP
jgi:hypothetical protein